jgi:hypothetical protein
MKLFCKTPRIENIQISYFDPADNPSASPVLDAIANKFPLNRKQSLVAEKIIQGAYPYDPAKRDQLLVHWWRGGTGKTQIIKAIVAAMRILKREQEIILLAPT